MYCQLVHICGCIPACIRHALADLPVTLDGTYERTLQEINKADWEFALRLFQFVAVAVRPLLVEELAELLAFDFKTGSIPKFYEDWRLEDPIYAVLSVCPSFLTIVDDKIHSHRKVVQFSHFSVKEFLTSARLAEANDIILRRYHISETPAQTLAAQACLGYLLHLDKDVTSYSLRKLPFTKYSAEYWVYHARLEDVSRNVKDGLKELFDPSKPHLAVCIWICDPSHPLWKPRRQSERPSPLRRTPLHYAAFWDLHSIIELLVNELSQNVNSQDFTDSATPLHVASERGYLEVARTLIERGADVSAQNKDGHTPLHLASQAGRLEVARILIERGADVSAQDRDCQTPLHLASEAGLPEVARMLIEHGASVSAPDKDGQTPLHLTILRWYEYLEFSSQEVARMLIERGADVSAQNKDGQPPLHLALQAERPEATRMLIERSAGVSAQNKDGQTPLHLASRAGQLEVAHLLIERGVDMSARDKDGQTPLHLASRAEQLEVAHMLIECDADMSARDKDGQTPLHLALKAGRLGAVRMPIERGADVSVWYKDGLSPFHLPSERGHLEVARMLIEHGASVSVQNEDGQNPLHLALEHGHLKVARMLIERGASVSVWNEDGGNPIYLALERGHLEVARMLIKRRVSVSAGNRDGQTPLHLAFLADRYRRFSTSSHPEDARIIERGTDVSAQDKDGQPPLHLALEPLGRPKPPGDTGTSCTGSASANHNILSPPSSPHTPIINPALLNVAALNNSVLMQAYNAVPVAPNVSTSSLEPESSPLNNPSGPETSTETNCAFSSCLRKRKATKNETGKGKGVSKWRKIAQGSQSRDARI